MPNVTNEEERVDLKEIYEKIDTMSEWVSFSSLGNDDEERGHVQA